MASLRVGSIVIRVDDLPRQTAFWEAALGYTRRAGDDPETGDFVLLHPPDRDGPNVSLDRVRSTVQIPPRIHLDLYAEDQAAEVERLIGLGARHVDIGQGSQTWVVLADPEGNEFCVLQASSPGA